MDKMTVTKAGQIRDRLNSRVSPLELNARRHNQGMFECLKGSQDLVVDSFTVDPALAFDDVWGRNYDR
jgi:hypothetical protein